MSFDEDQTNLSPVAALVMDSYSDRFPLPKNWPRHVKAAVRHIISLAHLAIIHAGILVVDSSDTLTKRAGDLHRSLDRISLLEVEPRIKDARRRRHHRPVELMVILEFKAAGVLS